MKYCVLSFLKIYLHVHICPPKIQAFLYVAPVSVFGFHSRELQAMENIGAQQFCVVMLSGGPLVEVVLLSFTFTDRTATS